MRKIISFLLIALFLQTTVINVQATNTYVVDEINVLNTTELQEINTIAATIEKEYSIEVITVLSNNYQNLSLDAYIKKIGSNLQIGDNYIFLVYNNSANEFSIHASTKIIDELSDARLNAAASKFANNNYYYDGTIEFLKAIQTYCNEIYGTNHLIPENRLKNLLEDEASLLSVDDATTLLEKLEALSQQHQIEIAIVTVDSLNNKTAEAYADDYYDYNGYGYGSDDSGILFLISMSERQWAISTYGKAIDIFTDKKQATMMDKVKPYLSSGDYYKAFNTFVAESDNYITQNSATPKEPATLVEKIITGAMFGVPIGLVSALIIVLVMKAKHKTVHSKSTANDYIKPGSFNVTHSRDMFLYRTVTKIRIKDDSNSGGSSMRTSSSGRSHGGSSGSF